MLRILIYNPASLGKNTAEDVPRQNVISYSYVSISFATAKNAEIRGLYRLYDEPSSRPPPPKSASFGKNPVLFKALSVWNRLSLSFKESQT